MHYFTSTPNAAAAEYEICHPNNLTIVFQEFFVVLSRFCDVLSLALAAPCDFLIEVSIFD
jgi:hypothetical protein